MFFFVLFFLLAAHKIEHILHMYTYSNILINTYTLKSHAQTCGGEVWGVKKEPSFDACDLPWSISIHIRTYIHIYIYTYIHTYTHVHTSIYAIHIHTYMYT